MLEKYNEDDERMCAISVIIPIYNVEQYLEQCVRSVMNQTFQDIEIICVNDGSTDGSPAILKELSAIDHRIKIINKHNSGYGHTMNVGLGEAQGTYISIVESDDYIDATMLETLYTHAKGFSLDLVKANYYEHYSGGSRFYENLKEIPYETVLDKEALVPLFSRAKSIWSGLYNREFLLRNNIVFHETKGASFQDTSFFFKVLLSNPRVMLLKSAYLHYRKDSPNSSMNSEKKMFCILDEFQEIKRFIHANGISDSVLIDGISREEHLTYKHQCDALAVPFKYAFIQKVSDSLSQEPYRMLSTEAFTEEEKGDHDLMVADPMGYIKKYMDYREDKVSLHNSSLFCLNEALLVEAILHKIKQSEPVYLYGAGQVAEQVMAVIHAILGEDEIDGVCVSDCHDSKKMLGKHRVMALEALEDKEGKLYLIATSDQYQFEIMKKLKHNKCDNVIAFNADLRCALNKYIPV